MINFGVEEVFLIVLSTMAGFFALLGGFLSGLQGISKWYFTLYFVLMSIGFILYIPILQEGGPSIAYKLIQKGFDNLDSIIFFLFVRSVLFRDEKPATYWYLWLLPILMVIFAVSAYLFEDSFLGLISSESLSVGLFLSQRVLAVVLLGVNIADVIRYRRLIRDTNSSSIGHQHRWVMSIVIISLISTIFPTFWIPISWLLGLEAGTIAANLVAGSIVFAYLLSLIVITLQYSRQTLAVAAPTLAPDPPKDNTPDQQAAEQAQVRELYQRVRQLFESERLFEAPDLRLSTVAKQLETSARSVSQAINTCGGKNFYEFVNDFRIRAAQHILEQSEDQQLTMQEVMYDVGYSSKSSFNKEFKKKTGLTPLQYRKKMSTNTRIRTV